MNSTKPNFKLRNNKNTGPNLMKNINNNNS